MRAGGRAVVRLGRGVLCIDGFGLTLRTVGRLVGRALRFGEPVDGDGTVADGVARLDANFPVEATGEGGAVGPAALPIPMPTAHPPSPPKSRHAPAMTATTGPAKPLRGAGGRGERGGTGCEYIGGSWSRMYRCDVSPSVRVDRRKRYPVDPRGACGQVFAPMTWTAPAVNRGDFPFGDGECASLEAYLDFHRATLLLKCSGLTDRLTLSGRRLRVGAGVKIFVGGTV